jgi:hypothetical protein
VDNGFAFVLESASMQHRAFSFFFYFPSLLAEGNG